MNENQKELIKFIEKHFSIALMQELSQLVHGDHESFLQTGEELKFLVEEHQSFLEEINFESTGGFNESLVERQKIDEAGIRELFLLNVLKVLVNKSINDYDKFQEEELLIMKRLSELIYPMENLAQQLWKFDIDSTKHTWWYQLDACICPVLDNQDMFGIDRNIIVMSCPLHGNIAPVKTEV